MNHFRQYFTIWRFLCNSQERGGGPKNPKYPYMKGGEVKNKQNRPHVINGWPLKNWRISTSSSSSVWNIPMYLRPFAGSYTYWIRLLYVLSFIITRGVNCFIIVYISHSSVCKSSHIFLALCKLTYVDYSKIIFYFTILTGPTLSYWCFPYDFSAMTCWNEPTPSRELKTFSTLARKKILIFYRNYFPERFHCRRLHENFSPKAHLFHFSLVSKHVRHPFKMNIKTKCWT